MLDHLIKGGSIVDGTGAPARPADVGIRDGRIVAIGATGTIDEPAANVVDATGLVVCPGFVDPHTHYDAQLFWDPYASPSNLHGITSIIAGNCGFTLAPLDPANADYLLDMMCKVEGMSKAALVNGVPWDWSSFADYLAKLDGRLGVNAAFLVGHTALRRHVMGARAVGEEATPADLAEMKRLLAAAIEAGGLGFSTSLAYTHSDADGQPVPSRWSTPEEVLELCAVVKDHEGTTLELVADGCMNGFSDRELDLIAGMSVAGQRSVNWNVLTIDSARPDDFAGQLGLSSHARAKGGRVVALTMPILVGMNMNFRNFCSFWMLPDWKETMELPLAEKIARLSDPAHRVFLENRAASPDAGVFGRLTGWDRYVVGDTFSAANEGLKGRRVKDIARERGVRDFACMLDIAINDELRTVWWPGPTDDDAESWRMRAEAWTMPDVMIGGSDAGAHLDRMCGAPYTTTFLADCIRGQRLLPMEEAVRLITDVPARYFGLRERGQLREGWRADVVVFDPATVGATDIELVTDLPGSSSRLFAGAVGVEKVFVNGTLTVDRGAATGELPGTILRSGRDTATVPLSATNS
jgi:N-acyl-D-aspartate/D-glutamate deacylase